MGEPVQGRQLLGPGLDAAGRHLGLLVPLEDERSAAEVGHIGQDVLQLLELVARVRHRASDGILPNELAAPLAQWIEHLSSKQRV